MAEIPSALIQEATLVTSNSARLNAEVADDGGAACEGRFRYRKTGYALSFDGTDDYVNVGTLGNFGSNLAKGKFECSFKTSSSAIIAIAGSTFGDGWFICYMNGGSIVFEVGDTELAYTNFVTTAEFNDGEWHHLEIIWDFVLEAYDIKVDGDSVEISVYDTYGPPESFTDFDYDLYIGASNWYDEVERLFDGSLSNVKLYQNSTLIGWWKMDEGTGTTAADSSGNDYDGTIEGASWVAIDEWTETSWANGLTTDDPFYADLTDLDSGTEYEFQAQLRNEEGESDWSGSEFFTTLLATFTSPFPCFRR